MNRKIIKFAYFVIFILSVSCLLYSGFNSLRLLEEINKGTDEVRYFSALIGGMGLIGLAFSAIVGMVIHLLLLRFNNRYRGKWEQSKKELDLQFNSK